jgi:SAM-dependent methyltransferase
VREWHGHSGELVETRNGFDVIACASCGFKHAVPIPSSAELDALYRQDYYSREKPLYLERARADLDWWNLVYADRYDSFEQLLPAGRRRVLDVGCGPGFFLLHGAQRGWRGLGIEPSRQAAAHGRGLGLEIVEQPLTAQLGNGLGAFDVVHLSEVLEHLPDPSEMIRLSHRLLAPGGVLCVVVPNDFNPFQRALAASLGYEPWWVVPPHHLNYFDRASLTRLFERHGFAIEVAEATFPIDLFLMMGERYVGDDALGRQCHRRRMELEKNLARSGLGELKRRLYRQLLELDLGREIVLIGRRSTASVAEDDRGSSA